MTGRLDASHPLALAALIGPSVALYNALGMAPLFTVIAVAALVLAWSRRPWRQVARPAAAVLIAGGAWAAVSLSWTIEPHMGLYTAVRMIGFAVGGLLLVAIAGGLDEVGQRRLRLALATGVTIALVLATIEIYWRGPGGMIFYMRSPWFDSYIPRLGRGLTVAAVLLIPAMAAAWRCGHRVWPALLFALAGLAFAGGHTLSAKIALAAAPGVFLVARWRPSGTGRIISVILLVLVMAFPLMARTPSPQETFDRFPWLPNSVHHRMTIWNFAASKLREHPIRGWGIEAARSIPGGEDTLRLWRFDAHARDTGWSDDYVPVDEQLMPLHPHSAAGQIWLELGAVGAILLGALLVLLCRAAALQSNRVDAAVMMTTLVCAVIVASVSYGIWQSWWLGSMWLAAALCTALAAKRTDLAEARLLPGDLP